MILAPTPAQTVGPFFPHALPFPGGHEPAPPGRPGSIALHGRVLDGAGNPVPDALVELWQPDPEGRVPQASGSLNRDGWSFTGWGRAYRPHRALLLHDPRTRTPRRRCGTLLRLVRLARGLTDRLMTRDYLPAHGSAHGHAGVVALEADPFLASLDPAERGTLLARTEGGGYAFDIRLQGADETVFFRYGDR